MHFHLISSFDDIVTSENFIHRVVENSCETLFQSLGMNINVCKQAKVQFYAVYN